MKRVRAAASRLDRTFQYRGGGVRIAGTTLACDTAGAINELVFLSHARLGEPGGRMLRTRAGRQQVLATDATLSLLGRAGEAVRRRALIGEYGRPFALGELRLELVPAGHQPGAASLLVEAAGVRALYAGPLRPGDPTPGAGRCEVREAHALCLDARYGDPALVFPPREEAVARAARFVEETLAAGGSPVLLAAPFGPALELASALGRRGVGVRGHRLVVGAAAMFRATKAPVPAILRFSGKLSPGEALLWPVEQRHAAMLGALPSPRFAVVGPTPVADVATSIPFAPQATFEELLAFTQATGAREVALLRGQSPALATALRERGVDVHELGPPQQIPLFAA